jgi:dihydrofolate reductase
MGRIVVSEFVSLDGVMEAPGGEPTHPHAGWSFTFDRGPDGDRFKLTELQDAEAMLLGRVTYEGFAAAWPSVEDEQGFAEKMNSMPKYVVSNTLREASWANSTILSGDALSSVRDLRNRLAGDILVGGSASLVHLLSANDLVDEYRLMVFPVLLGSGKRVFPDGERARPTRLRLVSDERSADVQMLVLRPTG